MGNDIGNDPAPAEHRDAPGGHEVRASWIVALAAEAHQIGDTLLDAAALYGAKKALDKFRKPPRPTVATPPPSDGK